MRQEFSKTVKYVAWKRAGGFCENPQCKTKLFYGKYEYHHGKEATFGGEGTIGNCVVLCKPCHSAITKKRAAVIAKNNRQREKNIGIKRKPKGRPMPGTKLSGLKKLFTGEVVKR